MTKIGSHQHTYNKQTIHQKLLNNTANPSKYSSFIQHIEISRTSMYYAYLTENQRSFDLEHLMFLHQIKSSFICLTKTVTLRNWRKRFAIITGAFKQREMLLDTTRQELDIYITIVSFSISKTKQERSMDERKSVNLIKVSLILTEWTLSRNNCVQLKEGKIGG